MSSRESDDNNDHENNEATGPPTPRNNHGHSNNHSHSNSSNGNSGFNIVQRTESLVSIASSTSRSAHNGTATTTTTVIRSSSSCTTSISLTSEEEQLRSIQMELERVESSLEMSMDVDVDVDAAGGSSGGPDGRESSEAAESGSGSGSPSGSRTFHPNNAAHRTRAGFNSVRDALGNLRHRLMALGGQHHNHQDNGLGGAFPSAWGAASRLAAGVPMVGPSGGGAPLQHQQHHQQQQQSRQSLNGREPPREPADPNQQPQPSQQQSQQRQRSQRHISWIQQLSDRLHMVDVAHSSHIPLQVMRERRRSDPRLAHGGGSATPGSGNATGDASNGNSQNSNSSPSSLPAVRLSSTASAPIFHLTTIAVWHGNVDGGAMLDTSWSSLDGMGRRLPSLAAASTVDSGSTAAGATIPSSAVDGSNDNDNSNDGNNRRNDQDQDQDQDRDQDNAQPPGPEPRRTSILFASRVMAHRLMMEGGGNDLLVSGGDAQIVYSASFGSGSGTVRSSRGRGSDDHTRAGTSLLLGIGASHSGLSGMSGRSAGGGGGGGAFMRDLAGGGSMRDFGSSGSGSVGGGRSGGDGRESLPVGGSWAFSHSSRQFSGVVASPSMANRSASASASGSASTLSSGSTTTTSTSTSTTSSTPRHLYDHHPSRRFDLDVHVHPSVSRNLLGAGLSPISERNGTRRGGSSSVFGSANTANTASTDNGDEHDNVAVEVSYLAGADRKGDDDNGKMDTEKEGNDDNGDDDKMEVEDTPEREDSVMDEDKDDDTSSPISKKTKTMEIDDETEATSPTRDVAIEVVDDSTDAVTPLITRRASKSLMSAGDSRHDHLSGSLHPSPRRSSFQGTAATAANEKCILYSWGRGVQTLHDDGDDRFPSPLLEKESSPQRKEEVLKQCYQVSSRIGSKSILAVSTGAHHSACATSQGALYVVGTNVRGCVDPDSPEEDICSRPRLLESIGQIKVVQVACGYDHTAALSSNGSVLTWGSNEVGQLGHRRGGPSCDSKESVASFRGPTHCRPTGMLLGKGRRASAIACGNQYTLVLTTRMCLLACGIPAIAGYRDASTWGSAQELPSLVGLPLMQLSAGDRHAAVVTAHGTALVWGKNETGCCGREYPKELAVPVPVKIPSENQSASTPANLPFTDWAIWNNKDGLVAKMSDDVAIQDVACGAEHTVLVTRSGRLLVCGSNQRGQLGADVSKIPSATTVVPIHHPSGGRFVSAEAGNAHSLLLDNYGDVWLTSSNGLQLVVKGHSVLAIAAGGDDNSVVIAPASAGGLVLTRQFSVEKEEDGMDIVDSVENLLQEISSNGTNKQYACNEIAKRTEELLKYPSVLNSVFLDPRELEYMFDRLSNVGDGEIKQNIASAIERGLKIGLECLRGDDTRLMHPEAVRCLLLYIKFFDVCRDGGIVFDMRGECISLFCDVILSVPFEGHKALHGWALNLYPREIFAKMLVQPLLRALNECLKFSVDENQVSHFQPSRQAVPVIVAVISWLHTIAEESNLAAPTDFYSDGVSQISVGALFDDLQRMKRASPRERSKNFYICAHPFLLSPGCKRNLLQMESQVEMYKAMLGDIKFSESQRQITVDPYFHLEIEREHLLKQTLEKIKQTDAKEIRKRLRVSFKGEEGIDAGGVTKEFFQLLSEELFEVNSGLWSTKYGNDVNWFNSDNTWNDNNYELIGVLFGLALYNSVLLDVRFPLAVYRKILGLPLGLEDIIDDDLRKGLQQLLEYEGDDVEHVFCLNFEVTWMELGEEKRLELKPDGANIPVTNENREEYVLRYVRWVLVDSIQPQWDSFEKGVMRVMESSSLDLFLPEELELLVVGSPDLDFDALEANTKYEGGYDKDSPVIKNFWKFVKEAPKDTQVQLLKFATASCKAPIGGLGKMDFMIQRAGPDSAQLPTSHTCFNTLILPDYGDNYEKLADLLGRAIIECEGFGLE